MTVVNLSDVDAIAAYIGPCRLINFNASSNNIGYRGLKKILKAGSGIGHWKGMPMVLELRVTMAMKAMKVMLKKRTLGIQVT
jgi:hypothetical protein